ncbi:MAG: UvrD-helicase domain-containing protein [Desulfamplus sp.]|nr:UvrD-helicase domain-containing protein [Desulfamplus sp.]
MFEHDIPYKYERNHWWSGVNYRPDFTIFIHSERGKENGVVIEYFGLKGDVDYDEMTDEKRKYWKDKNNWELVECSPTDFSQGGIDSFKAILRTRLEEHCIQCKKLPDDEIWNRIKDRAIDRFTTAMVGFIGKCRKKSLPPSDLLNLIGNYSPLSVIESRFLHLAHFLYSSYLARLFATGEEDFDGLMQRAAQIIYQGQTIFQKKSSNGDLALLRYICIDEYQDFSDLFYKLIASIREQNPKVELFCVGDDWQAINGFAGSDLKFFENFKDYIGSSHKLYIATNYRSSKSIVSIGNALMDGLGKPAVPHKESIGNVLVADLNTFEPSFIEKKRHPGDIITPTVLRLIHKGLEDGRDVVMLSRRNSIPWFINYPQEIEGTKGLSRFIDYIRTFFPKGLKERISISTSHKYKGLEKPMVIILDAVLRSYPLIHPDWVFSRILGDNIENIAEEERRLFYVALTRAVEQLVIITDGKIRTPFIDDLMQKEQLKTIEWSQYQPISDIDQACQCIIVKIVNESSFDKEGTGTYAIKDQLKSSGYRWNSKDKVWEKSFPLTGFAAKFLKNEIWGDHAKEIEIKIHNESEQLLAHYYVNFIEWHCYFDNLI